jgi:hypothetical protein
VNGRGCLLSVGIGGGVHEDHSWVMKTCSLGLYATE